MPDDVRENGVKAAAPTNVYRTIFNPSTAPGTIIFRCCTAAWVQRYAEYVHIATATLNGSHESAATQDDTTTPLRSSSPRDAEGIAF
ncbi:hypothetical protein [Luteibacter sp. CQ10]|uniref:hypothetical protein n=1 Tax=Luteibacter sp. CQ10 TaxID=2805821 RepID=UPI0034A1D710